MLRLTCPYYLSKGCFTMNVLTSVGHFLLKMMTLLPLRQGHGLNVSNANISQWETKAELFCWWRSTFLSWFWEWTRAIVVRCCCCTKAVLRPWTYSKSLFLAAVFWLWLCESVWSVLFLPLWVYWWLANQLECTLPPPTGLECGTVDWKTTTTTKRENIQF